MGSPRMTSELSTREISSGKRSICPTREKVGFGSEDVMAACAWEANWRRWSRSENSINATAERRGAESVHGDLNRAPRCRRVPILRGLNAVLVLTVTAFSVRMFLIRTENAVGARSAQVRSSHATVFETPNGLDPP